MFNRSILGIDIGTYSTKLALVSNRKSRVLKSTIIPTPPSSISDGEIKDIQLIQSNIKSIIDEKKIKANEIAFSLNSPHAIVRDLTLPKLADKEIESAVEFQLSQTFPGISETHTISYKIYESNDDGMKGIVTFAPNRLLEDYVELGKMLKIPVKYIDIAPNAAAKTFSIFTYDQNIHSNIILLDMGYAMTQISLLSQDRLLLSRSIDGGSLAIDKLISNNYNISLQQAELVKLSQHGDIKLNNEEIESYIRVALIGIDEQIRQVIDFFSYNNLDGTINGIVLAGQGSLLKGIQEYFKENYSMPVINAESKKKQDVFGNDFGALMNAAGAGFRMEKRGLGLLGIIRGDNS